MIEKQPDGWQLVGEIGVDAGICWIGDPCYIIGKDASNNIWPTWNSFCDTIDPEKRTQQYNYKLGHAGLGVLVSTGFGDGVYPVEANFKKGRVKEVRIKFF